MKNSQKLCIKFGDKHFATLKGSYRERCRRTDIVTIFMKLALQLIDDRAPQKWAGVFLQPDAGVKCRAVFGVYLGKCDFEHNRYAFGDVCGRAQVGCNSSSAAAAVDDISGDKKALVKIYWC